jgi:hypothetical protein
VLNSLFFQITKGGDLGTKMALLENHRNIYDSISFFFYMEKVTTHCGALAHMPT